MPYDLRAVQAQDLAIADFTYDLPQDRIAQQPLAERDASRLLMTRNGAISDHVFRDLPALLPTGSLLLLNDSRVVNARLLFRNDTDARIEVFCLEPGDGRTLEEAFGDLGASSWYCLVGNAKRWKGDRPLMLQADGITLTAERDGQDRIRLQWAPSELPMGEVLARVGHVPLPPYMDRPDEASDKERYNTVFAQHEGSVAAPTASLHFSDAVLNAIKDRGIASATLTLHVGAGTFMPVKSERMRDHPMHREELRIERHALELLHAQLGQGAVIPVGTTALRTLESIYWHGVMLLQERAGRTLAIDQWEPYSHEEASLPSTQEAIQAVLAQVRNDPDECLRGNTRLLIVPGYRFRFADALVTNFHQPQSTLLLLVAAFLGPDWRNVYQHALSHGYRFLSYGDGSLLWRNRDQHIPLS